MVRGKVGDVHHLELVEHRERCSVVKPLHQFGDKHIGTGDTCVFSIPDFKLLSHIKLAPGVSCLVMKGKHMGEVAKLEKIIERPGSHDTEAHLTGANGEFITVRKYLFAVDGNY